MKKKKTRKKRKKTKKRRKVKRRRKTKKRKVIFLVIDGLADLPISGKTPLGEARKPNIDYFARNGILGQIIPVKKSLWTDLKRTSVSHLANLSILGYNLKKLKIKRGPLEAVGANIPYKKGHLAVRCNFATVDNDLTVLDRHVGRNFSGLDELARYVNGNVKIGARFAFMRTYGHRCVLIIKEKLSDEISNSDPLKVGEKVKRIEALDSGAKRPAKLVQNFIDKAREVIEFHPANERRIGNGIAPANYIITREAGNSLQALPSFPRRYNVKPVCIAENGVMKATCLLAGFNAITVPELKFLSSLDFIFSAIKDALIEYDFVYAHIKGVDEAAHDGDFHKKREMIERIDKRLEAFRNFSGIFIVTCDHITSCKTRKHEYGPVPVLVFGKKKDIKSTFDEFVATKGKLGVIDGKKLWEFVFNR